MEEISSDDKKMNTVPVIGDGQGIIMIQNKDKFNKINLRAILYKNWTTVLSSSVSCSVPSGKNTLCVIG